MWSTYAISTNAQKILNCLVLRSGETLHEREIARKAGISYGSANKVLNQLWKDTIVRRNRIGSMYAYSVDLTNPYIREYKILCNLLMLEPLMQRLKQTAHKVVLFGSWATGSDTRKSDIDLFIVSSSEKDIRRMVEAFSGKIERKIQAIIRTPVDMLTTAKTRRDAVFMQQVDKGKVLWEKETDDGNL